MDILSMIVTWQISSSPDTLAVLLVALCPSSYYIMALDSDKKPGVRTIDIKLLKQLLILAAYSGTILATNKVFLFAEGYAQFILFLPAFSLHFKKDPTPLRLRSVLIHTLAPLESDVKVKFVLMMPC